MLCIILLNPIDFSYSFYDQLLLELIAVNIGYFVILN